MPSVTPVPENQSRHPSFSTLIRLWPYLWPRNLIHIRLRVIIASVALVLGKAATMLMPLFFKEAINNLSMGIHKGILLPMVMIAAYALARLASTLFSEIRDATFAAVTQKALRELSLKVFRHLHNLSLRYHLERQTGGLSNAIDRGTKASESLLFFLSFNILPTFVEIILVCGLLWTLYGYVFALITVVTTVAYVVFTLRITEWRIHFIRSMNSSDREAHGKAIDSLLNYETVKYFSNENYEANRFDQSLASYERASLRSKLSLSVLNIGQAIIISVGLAAVMALAAQHIVDHTLTIGDFVVVNLLLMQLYIPLFNLGFAYREVKLSLVNLDEMFSLLEVKEEIHDQPQAPSLVFRKGEIVFDNVTFSYTPDRLILKNLSFHVMPQQTVAIVGSSGAGKSTIARLLFRFYDVSAGTIYIDGQDIRNVSQGSLRRLIGIVPQDTVLFNDTIYYNIAYGNPEANDQEITTAAKLAHIHDFIRQLPQGYQTRVGERGLKLSGGEKQRVAIARTLLKKPQIFVFDEATSALDTRTEKEIQENLREISVHHSTLIIAHRLSTIIHADQILVLDEGRIVEQGQHADLLEKNGLYTKMWRRQQKEHKKEGQDELIS